MGKAHLTRRRPRTAQVLVVVMFAATLVSIAASQAASAQTSGTCGGRLVTVDLALGQVPTDGDDVIVGTDGDDVLAAGDGDDVICARGGNDTIWSQDGNDIIFGGLGDDKLRGGNGNDWLLGEDGADDLNGGRGNDFVLGGDGDDVAVRGGSGDDAVDGGAGNDARVTGNGGSDQVAGGPGDDVITGGPRPDEIWGGPGDDTINGNKGADRIWANDGADEVRGGPQPDAVHGGPGFDDCNGGTEADTHTGCESLTFLELLDDAAADSQAPVRTLPPGLSPGETRPITLSGGGDGIVALWGDFLDPGATAAFNPVGTPQIQTQLPSIFNDVRVSLGGAGEELVAGIGAVPAVDEGRLTLNVLRDQTASDIQTVLTEATQTLLIADGCVATTSELPLAVPSGLSASADAITAGELSGYYVWFESCNAPGDVFWSVVNIVVAYPGVGLVEIQAAGTTQTELIAAERALATLSITAPAVDFSDEFDEILPDAGITNVFGRMDFAEAGMSVELPGRFDAVQFGENGFNAFTGPEDTPPLLGVTRFAGDASLDELVVLDYANFAISDSCVSLPGDRVVLFNLGDGSDSLQVDVSDVSTPVGPGVAVVYEGCLEQGTAVAQAAVRQGGETLLFTVIADDVADFDAFDRLFETLILG